MTPKTLKKEKKNTVLLVTYLSLPKLIQFWQTALHQPLARRPQFANTGSKLLFSFCKTHGDFLIYVKHHFMGFAKTKATPAAMHQT